MKQLKVFIIGVLLIATLLCLFSCDDPVTPPETDPEPLTVTFAVDGEYYSELKTLGNEVITLPTAPQKNGYNFAGWLLDGETFEENSLANSALAENITVHASFTPIEYSVSFVADGEEVSCYSYTVENTSIPEIPEVPEKDGYFSYWEDFTLSEGNVTVNAVYKSSVLVTVKADREDTVTFSGATMQRLYPDNPSITPLTVSDVLGYRCVGYEVDGKIYEGSTITLENVTRDTKITVLTDFATYELPIINIDTDGVEIQNKYDYVDMTFTLENCEGELEEVTGGIRFRGNSTLHYPKKPYRIKFDKKQSLFGLEKAKSWVLLAEYLDPSALHNVVAFDLARQMPGMGFNPTGHKVNLYLNGEFLGLYTLCEQVQENEGRVGNELEEITADMQNLKDFNFLICMDKSVTGDADAVLDETYFVIDIPEYNGDEHEADHRMYIELKYPEKDQFTSEEQFESFLSQLKLYMTDLLSAFANEDLESLEEKINVNSLIDYLILDQIMDEDDHHFKSFYMYFTNTSEKEEENGKLSFGPVWDYDYSLGVPWQGVPNQHFSMSNRMYFSNIFFRCAMNIPELADLAKQRYAEYMVPALEAYIEGFDDLAASMDESVELNQQLWYNDPKKIGGTMNHSKYENFVKIGEHLSTRNVEFVKKHLAHRLDLLNRVWLDE